MAKMIYCKTCGAQIAKNAKTCPHCGARNKKHGFLKILLAVIILGGIGGAVSGGRGNRTQPTGQAAVIATAANQETESTETAAKAETEATTESVAQTEAPATIESAAKTETAADEEIARDEKDIKPGDKNGATKENVSEAESGDGDNEADGVTPELKEFLDQYEKCIDEYCNFMESFDANSSDPMAILKYSSLMQEYLDFAEKAEAYDEKEMTNEDLKYYIDVIARIEKRMLDVTVK